MTHLRVSVRDYHNRYFDCHTVPVTEQGSRFIEVLKAGQIRVSMDGKCRAI